MTGLPEDLAALAAGGKAALARCLSALETRAADASLARLLDAAFSRRGASCWV
jgi:LAO/AO transport system kinase